MPIPTYNMNSSDTGEYAYQQVSFLQSVEDNKDTDARRVKQEKLEAEKQAGVDKTKVTETPQRRPSLVVVLHVRSEVNMGQWCKV